MNEKKLRHEKALATISPKAEKGWFSRRTHGVPLTIRDRAGNLVPVVNKRASIRRNQLVRIVDGPPIKFKHTEVYR